MIDTSLTGDEAYARRLALSHGATNISPPVPLPLAETGDEAYQRRLAMSMPQAPPVIAPAPARIPSPEPPTLSFNPFAPPSVPPPPSAIPPSNATSASALDPEFEARLKSSRDAAAAVAAKLAKLASAAASEGSTAASEPAASAEERCV